MSETTHSFVIAAYKESPYLEELIRSLLAQTVKSKIMISTGTPNDFISDMAKKYDLPLFVNTNPDAHTISGDFSFALQCANTDYVTIAHQDDVYEPDYAEEILKKAQGRAPIIIFSEYYEIRNGEKVHKNRLLRVKEIMNISFRIFPKSKFVRKRVLSFGCSICCPAVTYPKRIYKDFKFSSSVVECVDWEAWLRLAPLKGEFLCIHKHLMGHRVHEGSTTTQTIADNSRYNEELAIFKRLWPDWFANMLIKKYHKACGSNDLK